MVNMGMHNTPKGVSCSQLARQLRPIIGYLAPNDFSNASSWLRAAGSFFAAKMCLQLGLEGPLQQGAKQRLEKPCGPNIASWVVTPCSSSARWANATRSTHEESPAELKSPSDDIGVLVETAATTRNVLLYLDDLVVELDRLTNELR
jgi:hypothetical protein